MKKIIAVVLLVVVILVAAPFVNGILVERTLHDAVEDVNTMYSEMGTDYSIEILQYNRGYRSSDIEWKINLGSLKTFYGVDEVLISQHAKHGYTNVVSTTDFEKNQWFKLFIDQYMNGQNPFSLTTTYSITGDIHSIFSAQQFTLTVEEETMEVKGGDFEVETDSDLKKFKAYGSFLGMSVADKALLEEVTIDSELEMLSNFLYDGYMNMGLKKFKVVEGEESVECDDIKVSYLLNVDKSKEFLSGETILSIGKIASPRANVDGAKVKLSMNNLKTQGYEEFMQVYTQTMSEMLSTLAALEGGEESASEAIEAQMTGFGLKLAAAYEKLLQEGIEFKISDLLVKLPQGDITGDMTIKLLQNITLMQLTPIMAQPELILDILYLKSDLRFPLELVGENPMLVSPFYPGMETGVFIQDGNYLVHSSETKDGKYILNDKEFVLKLQ